jgi:hypothetical protein
MLRLATFAGLLTLALGVSASGQTITWTGAGDGVNWGQAANWSPAQVPTVANDVVIPAGAGSIQIGAITATAATVTTARTIALTSGTSVISGGSWTLQSGATITFPSRCTYARITGATINGDLTVSTSGAVRLSNVTFNGAVNITGTASPFFVIDGTQTIGNAWSHTGTGSVTIAAVGNSTLTMASTASITGGSFTFQNNDSSCLGAGTLTINNAGTITSSRAGETITFAAGTTFTNTGTINASAGTLTLSGSWSNATGTTNVSGTAAVNFNGNVNASQFGTFSRTGTTSTVTIGGIFDLGSGTFNLNASTGTWSVSGNGEIRNGTLALSGGAGLNFPSRCNYARLTDLTITGPLTLANSGASIWNNVTTSGGVNITGTAAPFIVFEGNETLTGAWNNSGTGNVTIAALGTSTLTIPSTASITGGSFTFQNSDSGCLGAGTLTINNAGTITTNRAGETITFAAGTTFTNTGTLAASAGTLTLSGAWSNATGTINVSGTAAVNFNGNVNASQFGTFTRTGTTSTVTIGGIFDLGTGTFNLNAATGTWSVSGNGEIRNGTLALSGGAGLNFPSRCNYGRLTNLTITGALTLANSGASVWNNVTTNGGVNITGTAAPFIVFEGNETLTGAWNNSGTGNVTIAALGTSTLTIPSTASITGGSFTFQNNDAGCLGAGTLTVNNAGTITTNRAGETLTFAAGTTFTNTGTLNASAGTLTLSGTWSNAAGTINVSGSAAVNFGGNVDASQFGTFTRTGTTSTVTINGIFDLGGGTFNLNAATGTWSVGGNGELRNGTLALSGGAGLNFPSRCSYGRLTNLTITGALTLANSGASIWNNVTTSGGVNITGTASPFIVFEGNETLTGAWASTSTGSVTIAALGTSTLSIASTASITGGSFTFQNSDAGCLGAGTLTINNAGTITSSRTSETITFTAGTTFTNTGTLNASAGTLNLSGTWSNATGTINVSGTAAVNFNGNVNASQFGTFSRTGTTSTVTIGGIFDLGNGTFNLNASTGTWSVSGNGEVRNGTLALSGGSTLNFPARCSYGRLTNLTITGAFTLATSGASIWNNVTTNDGVNITGSANPSIVFEGNETLTGAWNNTSTGVVTIAALTPSTLTIPAAASISGGAFTFQNSDAGCLGAGTLTVANAGLISANRTNTTVNFAAGTTLSNTGTLAVSAGSLNLAGAWNNTGGTLAVSGTGTLDFNAPFNTAQFGAMTRTGGTVNMNSTMDLGGGTFALNASRGTWNVGNNAVVQNGTLALAPGFTLNFPVRCSYGRLSNLTITGELLFNTGGAVRWINTTISGALTVTGSASPFIVFEATPTITGNWSNIGTGTLTLASLGASTLTIDANASLTGGNINFDNADTGCTGPGVLTVQNNGLIASTTAGRTITFAPGITVANYNPATATLTGGQWRTTAGTIQFLSATSFIRTIAAGTVVELGAGQFRAGSAEAFGQLNSNLGTLSLLGSRDLLIAPSLGTFTNSGVMNLDPGCLLSITGNFVQSAAGTLNSAIAGTGAGNTGNIVVSGTAQLGGTFNTAYVNGYLQVGCTGSYRIVFANGGLSGTFANTSLPQKEEPYVAGMNYFSNAVNFVSAPRSDIVSIGGFPPGDGLLTGDDFVAFINAFAAENLVADVCGIGGPPSLPDGLITGDDFVAFVNSFAAACP